ncbi:hypothetical protein [Streptomyces sp. NPDC088246]|uniref:hypothetical protein n=1 Tax=Streptomyces sp. NPDC088246 TaxID=3365842 RepID=UPI00382ED160
MARAASVTTLPPSPLRIFAVSHATSTTGAEGCAGSLSVSMERAKPTTSGEASRGAQCSGVCDA